MIYNSLGYKCLIIWESELDKMTDGEVVNKVNSFFYGHKRGENGQD